MNKRQIDINLASFLAKSISQNCCSLKEFSFKGGRFHDHAFFEMFKIILEDFKMSQILEKLQLSNNVISQVDFGKFLSLLNSNRCNLKSLNLSDNRTGSFPESDLESIIGRGFLQNIDLSGHMIYARDFQPLLRSLVGNKGISSVKISGSLVFPESIELWSRAISSGTKFKELDLGNSIIDDFLPFENQRWNVEIWRRFCDVISCSDSIETLILDRNNQLSEQSVNYLFEKLLSSNSIKKISLKEIHLSAANMNCIFKLIAFSRSLKEISMNGNKIELQKLHGMQSSHGFQISSISLRYNDINDVALGKLCSVFFNQDICPNLEHFDVSWNNFGVAGLGYLCTYLQNHTRIKTLEISGNSALVDEGMVHICKLLSLNQSISKLCMPFHNFSTTAIHALGNVLRFNYSLQTLLIDHGQISSRFDISVLEHHLKFNNSIIICSPRDHSIEPYLFRNKTNRQHWTRSSLLYWIHNKKNPSQIFDRNCISLVFKMLEN
jgi:Ran GTPase-activating protein (RanGAP) involved in mRNA processing and transport